MTFTHLHLLIVVEGILGNVGKYITTFNWKQMQK